MANGTLDKSAGESGVKAAIRRPALKLQSDERLAKLGPAGFEAVTDRYRRPLTRHAAGIVGDERAGAVVDRAVKQARGLYRTDSRASAPGPWLYWMTHNLAVTELGDTNGNGSANGHGNGVANGNGATAIATDGSANGHANGATNGHVNGAGNGHAAGTTNGNGAAVAALSTLTYTEGVQQFTQDEETRKLVKGPRVRVRNGVGQLVPTPLLREDESKAKTQTGAGRPAGTATAAAASSGNRRTAIIFFGLCALAVIAAFTFDRINNADPDEVGLAGLPGQPTNTAPPTGTPQTGAAPITPPPIGTTTTPGATTPPPAGTTTTPGATTPPATGTSTTPGTTTPPAGSSTTPGTPPVTGSTPPASSTTTPAPSGTTPPASTTGSQQGGFAALFTLLGANSTVAQTNPLLTIMNFFGLADSSTPATPKARRPAKTPSVPKPTGSAPAITPSPTPSSPAITPAPSKPKPTPLGNAGPTISYNAAKGQANDVKIRKNGNRFKISDSGVSTLPINTGCRSVGATSEICKTSGVSGFDVDLGDKNDVLDLSKVGTAVTIAGGKGDDTITGGAGKDKLDGGAGSDRLEGVGGADTLTGGKGDDSLDGGKGGDVLSGEAGNDSITGGAGTDSVEAGSGDDSVDVADGKADSVNCGPGRDSVVADQADVLASDCESVSR